MSDKKYIELGKIIDAILSIPVPADSYFAQITDAGKKLCVSVVQNVQSADVAPFVHGHWVECNYEHLKHGFIEIDMNAGLYCSNCRVAFRKKNMTYKRYCPNCGAIMDEKMLEK